MNQANAVENTSDLRSHLEPGRPERNLSGVATGHAATAKPGHLIGQGNESLVPEQPLPPISREEKKALYDSLLQALGTPAKLNEFQARRCAMWQPAIEKALSGLTSRFNRCPHVVFDLELATVRISFDEMKILLNELLENALAYSFPDSRVVVQGRVEGTGYLICVSDEGHGMDSETYEHVAPYAEIKAPLEDEDGLGLQLCKLIAEVHSGALTIASTPGEGTTAMVVFPLD
ncbi:Histidine kinase domain-containing protein [Sulfidibacter corallicola]|uniref:histidine kinase n=1 Tax=Sulfidibacter corallicola TaxID=2818388 RepID=A0A8A4TIU5_SULCO|nr:ATP-binding protein [Sulfidibacter corallicola]QTD49114.1 hypothetical protein J3U87_26310 [Sulfidibacter corallicola]